MKRLKTSSYWRRIGSRGAIAFTLAGAMLGLGLEIGGSARADDAIGSVTQVNGTVQIQRAGTTLAAQQGTPVMLHDTVITQPDATATLGFGGGSSIALSGGTTVAIEDSTTKNGQTLPSRVTLFSGDIQTNVPDQTIGRQPGIEVDTPNRK